MTLEEWERREAERFKDPAHIAFIGGLLGFFFVLTIAHDAIGQLISEASGLPLPIKVPIALAVVSFLAGSVVVGIKCVVPYIKGEFEKERQPIECPECKADLSKTRLQKTGWQAVWQSDDLLLECDCGFTHLVKDYYVESD